MDLRSILDKTKKKSEQVKRNRPPVHIAIADRPYDFVKKETRHKPDTNRTQTGHKPVTKPDTNQTQTEHKHFLIAENNIETGHETEHRTRHKLDTNQTQTEHTPNKNTAITTLVGLQKELLLLLYFSSKKNRGKISEPLNLNYIADQLKIRFGSIKTSMKRLEEKGFILRREFKNGRGGWSSYEITENTYNELLILETRHKLDTNQTQTRHKPNTKPDTEPDTTLPSSSSNYINTTTTGELDDLTQRWMEIDISLLREWGLTNNHLLQIKSRTSLSPDIVQESINYFHFDLTRNEKAKTIKKTPLDFFMGLLVKGHPYMPPNNYISSQEEALQKFLERKRIEKQKQEDMENELVSCAFHEKWLPSLPESEKSKILGPLGMTKFKGDKVELSILLGHFKEHVWPSMREEYLSDPLIL